MSLRDEFVQIMNDEGAASEGGWHSWRCFDKGRYPEPCRCTEVVAEMLVAAALRDAVVAVKALSMNRPTIKESVVAAIEGLGKEQHDGA